MKTYQQQGDVLIKKIDKLPEGLMQLDTHILQESETTGHHHHFKKDAAVKVYQRSTAAIDQLTITPNFGKYIVVEEPSYLYHGKGFEEKPAITGRGDHDFLKIEPGIYEIDIVREYCYDTNEMIRVVD